MVGVGEKSGRREAASAPCRFCSIVRGDEAAWVVYEDEVTLAFLDIRPLFPGHTLLVPRQHVMNLPEMPADLVGPLFSAARLLTRAVQEAAEAEGTFVAMNNLVSQSVPHLHIHIVPRRRGDGLKGFFWPRQRYAVPEDALMMQTRIRRAVATLSG